MKKGNKQNNFEQMQRQGKIDVKIRELAALLALKKPLKEKHYLLD